MMPIYFMFKQTYAYKLCRQFATVSYYFLLKTHRSETKTKMWRSLEYRFC